MTNQTFNVHNNGKLSMQPDKLQFANPDLNIIFRLSDSFEITLEKLVECNQHEICRFSFSGKPIGFVCNHCHDDVWVGGLGEEMSTAQAQQMDAYVHGYYSVHDCEDDT